MRIGAEERAKLGITERHVRHLGGPGGCRPTSSTTSTKRSASEPLRRQDRPGDGGNGGLGRRPRGLCPRGRRGDRLGPQPPDAGRSRASIGASAVGIAADVGNSPTIEA